jgi:hypothetical protein
VSPVDPALTVAIEAERDRITERAIRLACSGCYPQHDLPADVACVCSCHGWGS